MSTKFSDLIICAPVRPNYNFKCALISNIRDKSPVMHSGACLSGFGTRITTNRSKQTVRYTWPVAAIEKRWSGTKMRKQLGEPITIITLRPLLLKFYHLCKDHGMLPEDFTIPKTVNNFYLKNIHSMPPSLLYAFIAHLRDVDEEPYFIYNLLKLVEKYDLNPWTAYVVSSALSIVNYGHHPLAISGNAGMGGRVRIDSMFNLRDYFANPYKKDKRVLLSPGASYVSWSAQKHIDSGRSCYTSGGGQIMFSVKEILDNIKKFNKALGMKKADGMAYVEKARRGKLFGTLQSYLQGMGWGVTGDYYEPWWLLITVKTKKRSLELIKQVKPYIEIYRVEKQKYGSMWNLQIKAKEKYISVGTKTKMTNFKRAKKTSRIDTLDGVMKP